MRNDGERRGNPQIGSRGVGKLRGHNTNHNSRHAVDLNGPADNFWVAPEFPLPQPVAQNRDVGPTRRVERGKNRPAVQRFDTQRGKEVGRYDRGFYALGLPHTREIGGHAAIRAQVSERTGLPLKFEKVGRGWAVALLFFVGLIQNHDAIRVRIGQRAKQGGVDDAEDGGIGTDAEGQSQDGDGAECRVFRQHADAEPNVAPQTVQDRS